MVDMEIKEFFFPAWHLGGNAYVLEQVSDPVKDVGDSLPIREKRSISGVYQAAGGVGGEAWKDYGVNLLYWEALKQIQLCEHSGSAWEAGAWPFNLVACSESEVQGALVPGTAGSEACVDGVNLVALGAST